MEANGRQAGHREQILELPTHVRVVDRCARGAGEYEIGMAHLLAFSRSRFWRTWYRRSVLIANSGSFTVRRLVSLFGSMNDLFPLRHWRACVTRGVPESRSMCRRS